jgi:hypothetical protein
MYLKVCLYIIQTQKKYTITKVTFNQEDPDLYKNDTDLYIQWNLCNLTPEFYNILWHPTNIYGLKVFLLTKVKPEYSDILHNPTPNNS